VAQFLYSMGNAVVDRPPDELIGAVIIALALSLAMAGVYRIRRNKMSYALMPMIVLAIVANLLSMAVAAGYMLHLRRTGRQTTNRMAQALALRSHHRRAPEAALAETLFQAADQNHDGRLSGEEASRAAFDVVRQADTDGKGSIDAQSFGSALEAALIEHRDRSRRHPPAEETPPPPPPGPGPYFTAPVNATLAPEPQKPAGTTDANQNSPEHLRETKRVIE
jgi:hypothetical protein